MKLIKLTQGQFAKVSDRRFEYLNQWKWQAHYDPKMKSYYAVRTDYLDGKNIVLMHRVIAATPQNMFCDHKDHDTLNNQDYNLRNCTKSQNQWNGKLRSNNTSGFKGVNWHKGHKKWVARLCKDGKYIFCKDFSNIIDAAVAYDEAAKKHYGEFAKLNFPEK